MKYRTLTVALAVLCLFTLVVPAFANSAEPPMLTILVTDAPDDLTVTLLADTTAVPLENDNHSWESYFRVYHSELYELIGSEDLSSTRLHLTAPSVNLDLTVSAPYEPMKFYNRLVKIDLDPATGIATFDTDYMPIRNTLLVLLRVSLTLVTEGIVLCFMGYRNRRSWLIFLLTNLVTQTLLNLSITGNISPYSYWYYGYIFGEALIFLTEAVVFVIFLREQSKPKAVLTAILANAVSLTCGCFLLSYLPI